MPSIVTELITTYISIYIFLQAMEIHRTKLNAMNCAKAKMEKDQLLETGKLSAERKT